MKKCANGLLRVSVICVIISMLLLVVACNKVETAKDFSKSMANASIKSNVPLTSTSLKDNLTSRVDSLNSNSNNLSLSKSDNSFNSISNSKNSTSKSLKPIEQYIKSVNDDKNPIVIVDTIYPSCDTVVANCIATDFGADKTGLTDSTVAIQNAINSVSALGGGTVFLPSGNYVVSNTISIPQYVSLRGDWVSPDDATNNYGTVILAKPNELAKSILPQDKPLISLEGNTSLQGLTVFYPMQDISNIKFYGYTIYADSPVTTTIKNISIINACYGIGVSLKTKYNELVNIENYYATCIFNALTHNATTDVGSYNNINIAKKYWQNALSGYACNDSEKLEQVLKQNCEAVVLGDLDDQLISNLFISDCKCALSFKSGIRENAGFWGLVNNANFENCSIGISAETLNQRSGVVITSSNVLKIQNNSNNGAIKLCDCNYSSAEGSGITIEESGSVDLNGYLKDINENFLKTNVFYIANTLVSGGKTDNSQELQRITNNMSNGGILVIPNGVYRINSTINIKNNIEIRSTQNAFSRTNQIQNGKNGVVFVSYVSGNTFVLGENSGTRGIRIWHAKNDYLNALNSLKTNAQNGDCSIKANGNNAYSYACESVGAYSAFDFRNCNNHILKNCYGIAYSRFILAGGNNGTIAGCLANPNFMTRTNLYDYFDSTIASVENWLKIRNSGESNADFAVLRDDIGRTYTKMVSLENASNEYVLNTFCYGEAGLFDITNSECTLINTSLDFIPNEKSVYVLNSGNAIIIGSLRVYGKSLDFKSGILKAYGRIGFDVLKEKAFDSTVSVEDKIEYVSENATKTVLFSCDTIPQNANGFTLNTNNAFVNSGSASWKANSTNGNVVMSVLFNKTDVSMHKKGYLHMSVYATNFEKLGDGQIEISSSSTCDNCELNWSIGGAITKNGWNDLYLPIYLAGKSGGEIDLSSVNYLRLYALNGECDYYIDNIEFVSD